MANDDMSESYRERLRAWKDSIKPARNELDQTRNFLGAYRPRPLIVMMRDLERDSRNLMSVQTITFIKSLPTLKAEGRLNLSDKEVRQGIRGSLNSLKENPNYLEQIERVQRVVVYDQVHVLYEIGELYHRFMSLLIYWKEKAPKSVEKAKNYIRAINRHFRGMFNVIRTRLHSEERMSWKEVKGKGPHSDLKSSLLGPVRVIKGEAAKINLYSRHGKQCLENVVSDMKAWDIKALAKDIKAARSDLSKEIREDNKLFRRTVIFYLQSCKRDIHLLSVLLSIGIMNDPEFNSLAVEAKTSLESQQENIRANGDYVESAEKRAHEEMKALFEEIEEVKKVLI